ncbi:MAG: hypothetical protein RIB57_03190 [Pelagibacterium sp.]|uniref:hypothetical protein n=1 Tax=Pelagibacterium sp. TaxID=1967288 RepID=UPI0032EFB965
MTTIEQIDRLAALANDLPNIDPETAARAQAMLGLLEALDDGSPKMAAMLAALRIVAAKDAAPAHLN